VAIADLTKAIELDAGSAAAYYRRALVRKDRKKYDLAKEDFREAARLTKDPELVKLIMQEIKNLGG
jgi:Tfp pilus assembly protein PilF